MGAIVTTNAGEKAGGVKSIQRGTVVLSGTSFDVNINEVDLSKAIVIINAIYPRFDVSNRGSVQALGKFLSPTTLRFERSNNSSYVTIDWQVVEFEEVKSLQYIEFIKPVDQGTMTQTINEVDLAKAVLFTSFKYNQSTTNPPGASMFLRSKLSNVTTIEVENMETFTSQRIACFVVEF